MTTTACVPGPDETPARDRDVSGLVHEPLDERVASVLAQVAYGKASNPDAVDLFGRLVVLSGDTLVVSAPHESSAARGINGNQADNSADAAGAVCVFVRSGTTWSQQAYLKASNIDASDAFGAAVALSGDTLAVGAPFDGSKARGINGNQNDNSLLGAGAVYVFQRSATRWTQQAYIKASNPRPAMNSAMRSRCPAIRSRWSPHSRPAGPPGRRQSERQLEVRRRRGLRVPANRSDLGAAGLCEAVEYA